MDETSREETGDQIDEDYSTPPEETRPLASNGLIFATFAEPGSSGMPGIESKANLEPSLFSSNPIAPRCRIALKPDPLNQGQYIWTFIPRAKGEGLEPIMWPQEVIILGKPVVTTQAVWDMYKCDPEYECYIPPFPGQLTVTRRAEPSPRRPNNERAGTPSAAKRTGSELGDSTDTSPRKRQRTTFQVESDDDEIQEMPYHTSLAGAARSKARREKERRERTQNHARRGSFRMSSMANDLPTMQQDGPFDEPPSPSRPSTTKEKFSMDTDPVQIKRGRQSGDYDPTFHSSKRFKAYQSEDDYLRPRRGLASRRGRAPLVGQKAKVKERDFWQGVDFSQFKGVKISLEQESEELRTEPAVKEEETPHQSSTPPRQPQPEQSSTRRSPPIFVDSDDDSDVAANGNSEYTMPGGGEWHDDWEGLQDSEDERERRLYASRRKMEELNERERRAREERRRREQENEARMRESRKQEHQRQRAEKLRQQSVEEEQQRKKAEKENRRRDPPWGSWHQTNAPWSESHFNSGTGRANFEWFNSYAPFGSRGSTFGSYQPRPAPAASTSSVNQWTPQNALDRYNKLSESFDAFKGTPAVPVPPLDQIPWPVLFKPGFNIERIDWESVEKFFEAAERLTVFRPDGREKWKEFLKLSTRRFHPDRWRARGIIGDKGYGIDIEEKVNHVSKVLTPLYRNAN